MYSKICPSCLSTPWFFKGFVGVCSSQRRVDAPFLLYDNYKIMSDFQNSYMSTSAHGKVGNSTLTQLSSLLAIFCLVLKCCFYGSPFGSAVLARSEHTCEKM